MNYNMLFTPLDQFDIIPILKIYCKYVTYTLYDLSISNLVFMFFFVFLSFSLLFSLSTRFINPTWSRLRYVVNNLNNFVKNLIIENIGVEYLNLFYSIFILFYFLLGANLLGMVPYSFTITSHLIITLTISFSYFLAINIFGILRHGLKLFGLFLPSGAPLVIAPFLICIEFISYIARLFSLGIRLFANMMAGHTLLAILSGFGWTMLNYSGLFILLFIFPVLIVLAVTGLEVSIAFLQAYVFSVLVCIYYNDVIHLH